MFLNCANRLTVLAVLAACKRDKVANLRQAIQLAGKHPAIVDVESFALQNCYEVNYNPQPGQVVALLNIGAATMNINVMHGATSVFTRDVTVGGNQYTALLQKELGLSNGDAEAVKRGMPLPPSCGERDTELIMRTVSEILALEIQKTFDFYRATANEGDGNVQQLLLAGGGSKLTGLREFLAERFELPVEWLDPFRNIKVDARKFDPDYMREVLPEMVIAPPMAPGVFKSAEMAQQSESWALFVTSNVPPTAAMFCKPLRFGKTALLRT